MLPRRYAPLLLVVITSCSAGADSIVGPDAGTSGPARSEIEALPLMQADRGGAVASALTLSDGTVSLWAVRGETRSVSLRDWDGSRIATFTVPAGALRKTERGRRIARGDSIRITMSLVDRAFAVKMQPAGLQFDRREPATLTFYLARASNETLRDGRITMWKQETPSDPWEGVPVEVDHRAQTATGAIFGFTVYALSY